MKRATAASFWSIPRIISSAKNDLMDNGDCSISLRSSSNNAIIGNNVTKNDWYGISLTESSNRNLIADNNASSNNDAGIYLDGSRQNLIRGNTAAHNAKGIYLSYDSNDNILEGNNVSYNEKGLNLANHSSNNTLRTIRPRRMDMASTSPSPPDGIWSSATISSITAVTPTTWARTTAGTTAAWATTIAIWAGSSMFPEGRAWIGTQWRRRQAPEVRSWKVF